MKKLLSLILAILLISSVCVLSGCGENGATSNDAQKDSKEKLVMATNPFFPPYEFYDGENIVGIDAEIAAAIAEDLGMELQIVDIEFDAIITGVQTKKYDIGMAGMTKTEEREQSVSFSTPYAKAKQVIIVKEDSTVKTFDDLVERGLKAGVQLSTTGDIYVSDTVENGGLGADKVTEFQTGNDAVAALVAGKVDCVIIDNEPAKSYVKSNEGLKILDTEYVEEEYAICFAKDNTELLQKVNASLAKLTENGTIQKIIDKYITA
ncbi:MAG: transporter substrate-binding domain-containing protein [Oscillospiraceae bacterium]|nr:transporter substrate-binding domain-containing protein [Candidatus Ruminococcus equi]